MSLKAFYDKKAPTRNLVTTITGLLLTLVSVVVSVLLISGKITQDQTEPLSAALTGIITVGGQLIGYVSAIVLMFKATDAPA
jgi:hypothetical protein